jgi:hypothetical protein
MSHHGISAQDLIRLAKAAARTDEGRMALEEALRCFREEGARAALLGRIPDLRAAETAVLLAARITDVEVVAALYFPLVDHLFLRQQWPWLLSSTLIVARAPDSFVLEVVERAGARAFEGDSGGGAITVAANCSYGLTRGLIAAGLKCPSAPRLVDGKNAADQALAHRNVGALAAFMEAGVHISSFSKSGAGADQAEPKQAARDWDNLCNRLFALTPREEALRRCLGLVLGELSIEQATRDEIPPPYRMKGTGSKTDICRAVISARRGPQARTEALAMIARSQCSAQKKGRITRALAGVLRDFALWEDAESTQVVRDAGIDFGSKQRGLFRRKG